MAKVFVDTDVILDLYVARQPFHEASLRFFSRLVQGGNGFTSALVISNVHYVLSKIKNRRYALERVRALRKLVSVAPVDQEIVDAALAGAGKDFEDDIQYQCALRNGMDVFVTRNTRHFPVGPLTFTSPAEYVATAGP